MDKMPQPKISHGQNPQWTQFPLIKFPHGQNSLCTKSPMDKIPQVQKYFYKYAYELNDAYFLYCLNDIIVNK